jgi:ubiquinone/menaquinone biosynthesis C-methylase UbiE
MTLTTQKVEEIYNSKLAKKYELSMPHSFNTWKKKAFNQSSIKNGDTVLVFCCGTGLDFTHIQKRIGNSGKIIGIDFSEKMLDQAEEKIRNKGWENVELIQADVTKIGATFHADVGVCTLGLSIIPEFEKAYQNLLLNVKENGEIIIGDMQLASGWRSKLNPLTIAAAKRYGGTFEGHKNALNIVEMMRKDLKNVKKSEFFFQSYFYCIGRK